MKAGIFCAALTGTLLTASLTFAADFVQGPFTRNASTRIVVDDHVQYITGGIKGGAWTESWTNMDWSGGVTDLTCVGWYKVAWPGGRLSPRGMLPAWSAVRYLSDAINRMTGSRPATVAGHDYSAANVIVLTTLSALQQGTNVPDGLLAKAKQALAVGKGAPLFSANEAFYIHTDSKAVYIVANQMQGLPHGVVELLLGDNAVSPQYQIGYEKLSMGPNWTHVPDFTRKPLVFNMEYAGRPGLYCRGLGPTRGSSVGATGATIAYRIMKASFPNGLPAPDETVEVSDRDWQVGFRIAGMSSPGALPSQNLEGFHPTVAANMLATGSDKGFLCVTKLGLDATRPPATADTLTWLWLNTDAAGANKGKIFHCVRDNKKQPYWQDRSRGSAAPLTSWCPPFIDMSVPAVRQMLLDDMIKKAESFWALNPGESYSYPHAEPSDGGLPDAEFMKMTAYPNWYSDYRKSEGQKWGPYALNGFYQGTPAKPMESWWSTMTPQDVNNAQSDTAYALNNWLLREFDKYVKSLPAADRLSGGIPKTDLVHTLCFSYSWHDVPPNFNFDHRVRMAVSGFALHRGQGKWRYCNTFNDVMRAMQVMLPECDMSQYWCYMVSFPASGWGITRLGNGGFLTPSEVHAQVHDDFYAVGGRNLAIEMDYDFGNNGLTYYMYAKMFWAPTMSLSQLKALRDRWLLRSYGAPAAGIMSQYYDLMSPKNFVSSPNMWAMGIRYIQQADAVIKDGTDEKQRLNELKQFWYYYYLQDHVMSRSGSWPGNMKTSIEPAIVDKVKEFLWKGQTSYIVPLYCFTWGMFRSMGNKVDIPSIYDVCSPTYFDKSRQYAAPAHYTAAETAGWWADVVKYFPYTPVSQFKDGRLSNGKPAADVDLNNLTTVNEFAGKAPGNGTFTYMPHHAAQPAPLVTAQKAGDVIGLKVFSPMPENPPAPFTISYTVDRWDPAARAWQKSTCSSTVASANDGMSPKSREVASLTFNKTVAGGIYRFNLGPVAGESAKTLSSLDYDTRSSTFSGASIAQGLTLNQRVGYVYVVPTGYVYIPKGTTTLDLETWDDSPRKTIDLYTGLPSGANAWKLSRTVDIHGRGPHRIPLNAGEDGSIACMNHGGPLVPYFYSIPNIWAKQPWMLMVPKDIAQADGLTSHSLEPREPSCEHLPPPG
jgi:hypothetical protein